MAAWSTIMAHLCKLQYLGVDMTTELPDSKLPDDTTKDNIHPSLIQANEADDVVNEEKHEKPLSTASTLIADDEINLGASKRLKRSKYGKDTFDVKPPHLRQRPAHSVRNRNSGH